MKNIYIIIMISLLFISCNNEKQNYNVKQGLTFEDIQSVNNQGFNFNKKSSYSISVQNNIDSLKLDSHKGCTAPCCADK